MLSLPLSMGLSMALAGCSVIGLHVAVLRGNYFYEHGDFQRATVEYLKVLPSEQYSDQIRYNLGNVYHSLGETEAALAIWEQAESGRRINILFGVAFNKGVQFYEQGRYHDAFEQFKRALTIDNKSVDAKINLELSLRKIEASETLGTQTNLSGDAEAQPYEDWLRVLEYIRRKEVQRWHANRATPTEPMVEDW